MPQGNYDHPAYLARLAAVMGPNTAGTTAQSALIAFPWSIDLHTINAVIKTAGTATAGKITVMNGTSTAGFITTGTATASSVVQSSANIQYTIPAGTVVGLGATDATVVADVVIEYSITPTATWLGIE